MFLKLRTKRIKVSSSMGTKVWFIHVDQLSFINEINIFKIYFPRLI